MKTIPLFLALFAWLPAAAQHTDAGEFKFRIDEIRYSNNSSRSIRFVALNNSPGPVTLYFGLIGNNFNSDKSLPITLVVPPNSSQDIAYVTQARHWEPFNPSLRYSYQPGNAFMLPDRNAHYILPFEKGTKFLVVQGPAGKGALGTLITHDNDHSRYAFDLGVSEGTPVVAAREGMVVDVKDHFTMGAPDPSLSNKANFVAIMHDDRSIAYYMHLSPRSALVKSGQWVWAGDRIANTGNTGFTYGPHLHFDVRRAAISEKGEAVLLSIPVNFYQRDGWGERIVLEEDMMINAK